MGQKKYEVEQIIMKLREIEILCNHANTIAEAARQLYAYRSPTRT
jgi:hypothetical protein